MKIFLLSHKPDIDGVTPVILSKMAFGNLDYLLVDTYEANPALKLLISDKVLGKYDLVYITDLSIDRELCDVIDSDESLRSKIRIFDHHKTNLFIDDYSFGCCIDTREDGNRASGTSLYYEYLLNNHSNDSLLSESVSEFVELVRQYDTWEWQVKYNNMDAQRLSSLFDIYGSDYFIRHYLETLLRSKHFKFSEKELYLLDVEKERIDTCFEEKEDAVIPINLLGHNAGLVFSENYRNEVGSRLAELYKDEYEFIIIMSLSRAISYRSLKEKSEYIDLGQVAKVFGGKGHPTASSSPITDELLDSVIESTFGNKVKILDRRVQPSIYDKIKSI